MQHFVIEGERATFRFRPLSFPGGSCLFAGLACALMNLVPIWKFMTARDLLNPLAWIFVAGNLLMAAVGLGFYCTISTVIIDKAARRVTLYHELCPPLNFPRKRFMYYEFDLAAFNRIELNPGVSKRSSPSLSLCGPKEGVQLLGSWLLSGELQKTGESTAAWLNVEFKVR